MVPSSTGRRDHLALGRDEQEPSRHAATGFCGFGRPRRCGGRVRCRGFADPRDPHGSNRGRSERAHGDGRDRARHDRVGHVKVDHVKVDHVKVDHVRVGHVRVGRHWNSHKLASRHPSAGGRERQRGSASRLYLAVGSSTGCPTPLRAAARPVGGRAPRRRPAGRRWPSRAQRRSRGGGLLRRDRRPRRHHREAHRWAAYDLRTGRPPVGIRGDGGSGRPDRGDLLKPRTLCAGHLSALGRPQRTGLPRSPFPVGVRPANPAAARLRWRRPTAWRAWGRYKLQKPGARIGHGARIGRGARIRRADAPARTNASVAQPRRACRAVWWRGWRDPASPALHGGRRRPRAGGWPRCA